MFRRVFLCSQSVAVLAVLVLAPAAVFATIENETYDQLVTAAGGSADSFGENIVNIGDMNGDGYNDLLVSHSADDTGATNAGAAHVFYGNASGVSSTADLSFFGTVASQFMSNDNGNITGGDVNGDGYADVIIGTFHGSASGAKVFFGGASPNTVVDVSIVNGYGSYSLDASHDINDDGYDDIVLGNADFGKVQVYFGGSPMNAVVDISFAGTVLSGGMGASIAPAGDVNGDGNMDWIFGENGNDTGGTNRGAAFIFFGSATTIDTTADVTIPGLVDGNQLGFQVAGAGDVNNDGYDDVMVSDLSDVTGTDNDAVYIYYGGVSMDATVDITILGVEAGASDFMGSATISAGDVNGDGYDDILIEAYTSTGRGRVDLFYGGASMDTTADITLNGENASDAFGSFWHYGISIGDVNDDDAVDWVFGAPGYPSGASDGAFYVYLGTPPASSSSSSSSSSSVAPEQRGGAAGGAGPGGRTAAAAIMRRAIMLKRFRGLLGFASSRASAVSSRSASLSSVPLRCSRIQSVLRRNACIRAYRRRG